MAQIDSSIPLQVKAPQIDLAAIEAAAQQAHARDQESQLTNFKIQEAPALMAYGAKERETGVKKMDAENAALDANKEAGYPDIKKKLFDVYKGMDQETYEATVMKQRDMREAYNYVMSFPPGEARKQAFDARLAELHKKGVIDDRTARHAFKSGPTDLFMTTIHDQLKMLEEITNGPAKPTSALDQSRIDLNRANTDKAKRWQPSTGGSQDPVVVANRVGNLVKNLQHTLRLDDEVFMSSGSPESQAAVKKFEAAKAEIYKRFNLDENGAPMAGAPGAATIGTGVPGSTEVDGTDGEDGGEASGDGSEDNPFEPQSPEDMQGLKDGDHYINPADGELYIFDSSQAELG